MNKPQHTFTIRFKPPGNNGSGGGGLGPGNSVPRSDEEHLEEVIELRENETDDDCNSVDSVGSIGSDQLMEEAYQQFNISDEQQRRGGPHASHAQAPTTLALSGTSESTRAAKMKEFFRRKHPASFETRTDKDLDVSASPTAERFKTFIGDIENRIKTGVTEVSERIERRRKEKEEEKRRRSQSLTAKDIEREHGSTQDKEMVSLVANSSSASSSAEKTPKKDPKDPVERLDTAAEKSKKESSMDSFFRRFRNQPTPEPQDAIRWTPTPEPKESYQNSEMGEDVAAQLAATAAAVVSARKKSNPTNESQERSTETSTLDYSDGEDLTTPLPELLHDEHKEIIEPPPASRIDQIEHFRPWPLDKLNAVNSSAIIVGVIGCLMAAMSPFPSFLNGLLLGTFLSFIGVVWLLIYVIDNYFTKKVASRYSTNTSKLSKVPAKRFTSNSGTSKDAPTSSGLSSATATVTSSSNSVIYADWMHQYIGDFDSEASRVNDSDHESTEPSEASIDATIDAGTSYNPSSSKQQFKSREDVRPKEPSTLPKKKTQLVYVRLDGTTLRINRPKKSFKKPKENSPLPPFVHQKVYDFSKMAHKEITLLMPKSVRGRRKYIWTKKYPICIEMQPAKSSSLPSLKAPETIKMCLFVHNARDKEVWFWRLVEAAKLHDKAEAFNRTTGIKIGPITDASFSSGPPTPRNTAVVQEKTRSGSADDSNLPRAASVDLGYLTESQTTNNGSKSCLSIPVTPINAYGGLTGGSTSINSPKASDRLILSYESFMSKILSNKEEDETEPVTGFPYFPQKTSTKNSSTTFGPTTAGGSGTSSSAAQPGPSIAYPMAWFNALIGRIFYDILTHPYWHDWVSRKIQRKLARLRMPHFIPKLTLTEVNLGSNIPIFKSVVSEPVIDSRGLWVDLDMTYAGGFTMTLETKLDLIKFKELGSGIQEMRTFSNISPSPSATPTASPEPGSSGTDITGSGYSGSGYGAGAVSGSGSGPLPGQSTSTSVGFDLSDESDSFMSSSSSEDEGEEPKSGIELEESGERAKQKVLKVLEKVAASSFFQQFTEIQYIKEAMERVSNCPLILTVQIQALDGILCLNIPPPPTDRLWYAFRKKPNLVLSARPKFGDREVSGTHFLELIEKRLKDEFNKVLVMPNMDDLIIPALITTVDQFVKVVD